MKVLFIVLLFATVEYCESKAKPDWDTFDKHKPLISSQGHLDTYKPCNRRNVTSIIQGTLNKFMIECVKKITRLSPHYVFSPMSMWLILATIAEGLEDVAKLELIKVLNLPEDDCVRKQFYQLEKILEPPGEDVVLARKRFLILDEDIEEGSWKSYVRKNNLIKTMSATLNSDPIGAVEHLSKTFDLQLPSLNTEGHSIIIDTLDYNGLWCNSFEHAIKEKSPFYDDNGMKVGYVDLMKIKLRVKMVYIPAMNIKVLELPVGFGGRYKMLLAMNLQKTQVKAVVEKLHDMTFPDIIDALFKHESIIPLNVAIPRFRMTTEIDMRRILEELGIKALWTDEGVLRNISDPEAFPSSYIQRTTVTFDTTGVKAPFPEAYNIIPKLKHHSSYIFETGLEEAVGRDFIVDRPFYYGLFDSKTHICLFCGVFSTPTYKL